MADLMERLGSKMQGKVADAATREAQGASTGVARPRQRVARAPLVALVLAAAGTMACEAGAAPALPDPGPNGVTVALKSEPSGANVMVDGILLGPTPLDAKLRPGPHHVRAILSGYYPAPDERIQVGATEPTEVTLHLIASH